MISISRIIANENDILGFNSLLYPNSLKIRASMKEYMYKVIDNNQSYIGKFLYTLYLLFYEVFLGNPWAIKLTFQSLIVSRDVA